MVVEQHREKYAGMEKLVVCDKSVSSRRHYNFIPTDYPPCGSVSACDLGNIPCDTSYAPLYPTEPVVASITFHNPHTISFYIGGASPPTIRFA